MMISAIELCEAQRIDCGADADVFNMHDSSRACKILRAKRTSLSPKWALLCHQQELEAYRIAAATPALRDHVARCFGPVEVTRVRSETGHDVSDNYLLTSAFALELLSGRVEKAGGLDPVKFPYVRSLLDAFDRVGLYALDSEVFSYESEQTMKFIDFTTK